MPTNVFNPYFHLSDRIFNLVNLVTKMIQAILHILILSVIVAVCRIQTIYLLYQFVFGPQYLPKLLAEIFDFLFQLSGINTGVAFLPNSSFKFRILYQFF